MAGELMQHHGGDIYGLARRLGREPGEIIDFSANINPLGISPRADEALRRKLDLLPHYPDPDSTELRDCLSEYHALPSRRILVGNGSTELIYLLARALKPREVVIGFPTFGEYERACRQAGATIRWAEQRHGDPPPKRLEGLLRAATPSTDLIFLCNPNNPTGWLYSPDEVRWLAACLGPQIRLVLDEAFIDYCPGHSLVPGDTPAGLPRTDLPDNVVVLRSFTKFFALAGLRVGYLVGPNDLVTRLRGHREPWTVNTLAAAAAEYSRRDQTFIRASLDFMRMERPRFSKRLARLPGLTVFSSSANYLLIRFGWGMKAAQRTCARLSEQGILVRNCASFRGLGPQFVRLAVRKRDENELLCQTLQALAHKVAPGMHFTAAYEEIEESRPTQR